MSKQLPETYIAGFHDENAVRKMKYFQFGNTGWNVSQLSIGTGGFCLQYGDYTIDECKATLHDAIKSGVNYIDTAPWYGHGVSEEVLGKCLEGIPRKAYYLATKVGRYERDPHLMFDFSAKKVRESIDISLKKLGIDQIDLIQVHDVEFAPSVDIILKETLPALEEAAKLGKVKFIGITGYPVSILDTIIKQSTIKIDSVLSYTRLSLVDSTLKSYLPFFQSKNLGIINAAAHCMGLLSGAGPQDWHPAPQHVKDICTEAREYCVRNGVELGKLALFHSINEPGPHTNLVGMNTRALLKDNLEVIHNGINTKEQQVYQHIKDHIFTKLKQTHWEGFEVERHWNNIKESIK